MLVYKNTVFLQRTKQIYKHHSNCGSKIAEVLTWGPATAGLASHLKAQSCAQNPEI